MPETKPYLTELKIDEVSPVRRPGNFRKKVHQRSEDIVPKKTAADVTKNLREHFARAEMTDKAKATLEAALAAISEIKGEMDDAQAEKLMAALQAALEPPAPAEVTTSQDEKRAETEVARSEGSADVAAELETIRRAKAAQDEEIKSLRRSIDDRDRADRRRGWVTRSVELEHIPGTPENIGGVLAEISEIKPELANKVDEVLRAANAALSESALFTEFGSSAPGPGSAISKLSEMAKERVARSEGKLTMPQALRQLRRENHALASQAAEEHIARR